MGVRRIACGHLTEALRALQRRPLSDGAVHAARKSLKKTRAMLRLLRPSVGGKAYRRENIAVRDAALALSEARDAKVRVQTLQRLGRRLGARRRPVPPEQLYRVLRRERAALRRTLARGPEPFAEQLRALRQSRRRILRWRVGRGGWSVIGKGLVRVYGQARRARSRAGIDATEDALHEWRKQTKYLCHQLQVLESLGPAVEQLAQTAHAIADALGEHHDLYVLRARISATIPAHSSHRGLLALIDRRCARLKSQAIALGQRLYADPEPVFEARLHSLWRIWRAKPPDPSAAKRRIRSSSA